MWCDTARPAKFFMMDARAASVLLLLLLWPGWGVLFFSLAVMAFFGLLSVYGYSMPVFFRMCRAQIAGRHRVAHSGYVRRKMYGRSRS